MPMADRFLICASCGVRFLFSAAEQREQAGASRVATPPTRCPGCRALEALAGRRRGQVKWYNARQGYGFIREPDGTEIFVHSANLAPRRRALRAGQTVEYEVIPGDKGWAARAVTVIATPSKDIQPSSSPDADADSQAGIEHS